MEFLFIKTSGLLSFVDECINEGQEFLPLTPWRAASQVLNPFASEDEILLIVAKDNTGKIRGYIGILPALFHGDPKRKIFWNSCWWADPESSGVAIQLFLRFLQVTGKQVAFSDLSEKTVKIIERMEDFYVKKRSGVIIRFRSGLKSRTNNRKMKGAKDRLITYLNKSGLLRTYDVLFNLYQNRNIAKFLKHEPENYTSGIHYSPTPEMLEFIRLHTKRDEITLPVQKQIEWWEGSRWLVNKTPENEQIGEKYYFSAFAENFYYSWCEVFTKNERAGIACLSVRDGVVKTHYMWYREEFRNDFFGIVISHILSNPDNHSLISFHEEFADYAFSCGIPFLICEKRNRYTAISNKIEGINDISYIMQDGDGDYIFT